MPEPTGDAPAVTVFTPSHNARFLGECYDSLRLQTYGDWEWVVVLNGGASWTCPAVDPRVRIVRDDTVQGVGAAKRLACALARGDVLVELDHDDVLASECLADLVGAFAQDASVGFVFSNFAQITEDGGRDDTRFNEANGWQYRDVYVDGRSVLECRALEATPHNVSYIWFAPNHVRAFRRSTYEQVGGYDAARDILDDQDLIARLYGAAGFAWIDKCLYLQRMHSENTQRVGELNQRIQRETIALYDAYLEKNTFAWTQRAGLRALDLAGSMATPDGYERVTDLIGGLAAYEDSSVGLVRAIDVLPLVSDRVALFNELHRVMAHSAMFITLLPSTDGRGAFQDPRYVSFWNENSFWYLTDSEYVARVPDVRYRFQSSRLVTYSPGEWFDANKISYVACNLIALKEGPRNGGILR